jgi:arylsulfatase A-like enzyme
VSRSLSLGKTGSDVGDVQRYLIKTGYLAEGNDTGYYGFATTAAVGRLQVSAGIVSGKQDSAYGIFGPKTLAEVACGKAKKQNPMNVVFVLTDDQAPFQSVDKMPYLSSRTDWITFDNAYENVSVCCPSRAAILSGQYDTHNSVQDNGGGEHGGVLFNESGTLPVWLDQAGYQSALVGKYLNHWPFGRELYMPPGWDSFIEMEPSKEAYFNYDLYENGVMKSYGGEPKDYQTNVLADKAVRFLETAKPPFFLYFTPHAPHKPFTPAPKYEHAYDATAIDVPPSTNEADVSDKPKYIRDLGTKAQETLDDNRRSQWEMLLSVDDAMKRMDQVLEARGIASSTVVIFMTDNGYAFGEHRWRAKRCPYDVCMKTPLYIRYPGQAPRRIDDLASNIDIASTIAEIAGVTPNVPQDGHSLLPLITGVGNAPTRDAVLEHWVGRTDEDPKAEEGGYLPAFWSVRTKQYRYTEYETGEKELYNYAVDPFELDNQANKPVYTAIQSDLAAKLATLKAQAETPISASALPARPNYVIADPNWTDAPDDE